MVPKIKKVCYVTQATLTKASPPLLTSFVHFLFSIRTLAFNPCAKFEAVVPSPVPAIRVPKFEKWVT